MTNTTKNILAWVIVALALAAGIYFFGFTSERRIAVENNEALNKTPDVRAETLAEENTDERYTLDVDYPVYSGLSAEREEKLNGAIREFIQEEIEEFKKQVAEFPEAAADSTYPSTFSAEFSTLLTTGRIISVRFDISAYMSGAAHPFNYSIGYNYDIAEGRKLELADLFAEGTDHIARLSDLSISQLLTERARRQDDPVDQQQEQWIRDGASPKAENFAFWALSEDALIIFFNPYQVAPYAAGVQEVRIPFADIQGILRSDGPIGTLGSES